MLVTFSGRRASQDEYELTTFVNLLVERGVSSYLEIGARHGDTFHYIMSRLPAGSRGIAVDLGGGPWGTPKSVPVLRNVARDLRAKGYTAHIVFGDSRDENTISTVVTHGHYDAVFIDGDHRYDGVKADWLNYGKLAPIVGFHDIVGTGQSDSAGNPVEVPKLWRELANVGERKAIVSPGSKMGIGVILK